MIKQKKTKVENDWDWNIESRDKFKKGEIILRAKDKMSQQSLDNMLKTLCEEIEIIPLFP